MTSTALPDDKELQALEQKFDPEMRFRPLVAWAATLVGALLIALSAFHYYTAGFGLLQEVTHRGVHLAFVLGLIFLVFPHRKVLLERDAARFEPQLTAFAAADRDIARRQEVLRLMHAQYGDRYRAQTSTAVVAWLEDETSARRAETDVQGRQQHRQSFDPAGRRPDDQAVHLTVKGREGGHVASFF